MVTTFGERLRELRKAQGMSQRELAQKAGISFAYVSKLETGDMVSPRAKTISAVARVLKTDRAETDELFGLAKKLPSDLAKQIDVQMIEAWRSFQARGKAATDELATLRRRIARQRGSETQRKRLQEPVGREEEPYRAIVENTLDGIVILGSELEIIYENPAAAKLLGYRPREFVGQDALGLIHPDDMSKTAHRLTKLAQTPGYTDRAELRMKHKDGSWRVVDAVANNLLHDPGVRGIVIDVREMRGRPQSREMRATVKEYHLTESQQRVLDLMVEGRSNRQIAEQLVISPSTVRFHVSSILRKLGATSRAQASAIAVRRHLVS